MATKSRKPNRMVFQISDSPEDNLSKFDGYEEQPVVSIEEAIKPLITLVPDIEQMVQNVIEKSNEISDSLSLDEIASIMLYTLPCERKESSFNYILNGELLRSKSPKGLKAWFPYIRLFMEALQKLPPSPLHTVYCPSHNISNNQQYVKDRMFIWWNFISCTSAIEYLKNFNDENQKQIIFIIECDTAKDISKYFYEKNQINLILYPARQFRVISESNFGTHTKFIQLKEIQPRFPFIQMPNAISNRNSFYPASDNKDYLRKIEMIIENSPSKSTINLIKQNLTDRDMDMIVQRAIIGRQCEKLLLSENQITGKGLSTIANGLKNNTTLKFLSLAQNVIDHTGIKTLAQVLGQNNCELQTLSLHSTSIDDQSIEYISTMLETNRKLTWLHLGGNNITDKGVKLLANTLVNPNTALQVLGLSHNKSINGSSVDDLIEMMRYNKSLETLWIHECSLNELEKKKLKENINSRTRFFILIVDSKKYPPINVYS